MKAALAFVVVLSSAAHADPTAGDLVASAKRHFDVQEYTAAEHDLINAYKLDPKPEILYALAQAQRMAGECDKAIVSYKNFLRTNPRDDLAKLAQDNIDTCSKVEPKPEPLPNPQPPKPVAESPKPIAASGPNWPGRLLIAGGVISLGAGGYLAYKGQHDLDAVANAKFYDDFLVAQKNASGAKTQRTIGYVAAGTGAALVVAGIVTYFVRAPAESPTVAIGPHGEIGVAWGF